MEKAGNQDLIDIITQFYQSHYSDEIGVLAQNYPNEQRSLFIDYTDLYSFDRDLAEDFRSQPDQMREYFEEALRLYDLPADVSLGQAHVRIGNLPETVSVQDLRVHDSHIGKLIAIPGVVRHATEVQPKITESAFECQRCGTMTYIPQSSDGYQEPHECQGCQRQGPFRVNLDQSEFVDHQSLRLQGAPEGLQTGESPQSIEVDLVDDITGEVEPGDHVTVTGVLHLEQTSKSGEESMVFDRYLDAVSIISKDELDADITRKEELRIQELSEQDDILEKLSNSIAPSILGHEEEKLAITLQLFGGLPKKLEDDSFVRGNTHTLFVGDPGTGRSRLLRRAVRLSPRATYSNGSETTRAGLTAAAERTGGSDGPWRLESGALPIADKGLAAIDNLEEIHGEQQDALHEPMERQQISISKASINKSLDTRISVLAASSPKYGRFDPYEPLGDQIELDPKLLSRFDLIFTFKDQPDADRDAEIAEHVLEANREGELNYRDEDGSSGSSETALEIDEVIFRKYIAYSRQNCEPVLTEDAKETIKEFYVDIRKKGEDIDAPVPVSARKLESLVRLSEASARARLADEVSVEDTERAIEIVETSLRDVGVDPETGEFDTDVIEVRDEEDEDALIEMVKELIDDIQEDHEHGAPIEEILQTAEKGQVERSEIEEVLRKMRNRGVVYEPKQDYLKLS